jgi:hypothetical protein
MTKNKKMMQPQKVKVHGTTYMVDAGERIFYRGEWLEVQEDQEGDWYIMPSGGDTVYLDKESQPKRTDSPPFEPYDPEASASCAPQESKEPVKEYVPYGINGEYFVYSNKDNHIPMGYGSKGVTKKKIQAICDKLNAEESEEPEIETHEYLDHPDGGLVSADFNNRTGKYVDEESKEPLVSDNDYMEWFYEHDNEWQNDTRNNADGEGEELIDYLRRNYKIEPREVKEPLGITPGELNYYDRYEGENAVAIKAGNTAIAEIIGEVWSEGEVSKEQAKANAKAICTAVNSTYKKGYNPEAMEGLYKALENELKHLNLLDHYQRISEIKQALKNAKL